MTVGVLVLLSVVLLLFMAVVAGLVYLGVKLFGQLQTSFFSEIRRMNEERSAERTASQEQYAAFMEAAEAREQIVAQIDEEWVKTPESAIAYDDDLQWEAPDA